VSSAVGLAVLDAIKEDSLLENARNVGSYLAEGMRQLMSMYPVIGDVRSQGLFLAVELVSDKNTKEPASNIARSLINRMKDRRVLISRLGPFDNVLKIRPPLPFSKANADRLLQTLDTCLKEVGNV